jgi:hypothetical protein
MVISVNVSARDSGHFGPSCDFEAQVEFPARDLRDLSPEDFAQRYFVPIAAQASNFDPLFERSSEDF